MCIVAGVGMVDVGLTNVANKQIMQANGWMIDCNSDVFTYGSVATCRGTFWCFKEGLPVGSVSAFFKGSGRAALRFGNCGTGGVTNVRLCYLTCIYWNYI